jgi:acetylornithine deacetylase/succinyl-diaminopimelate desuccinylase-like protein
MAVRSAFVCEQGRRLHVSNQGSRAERYARRAFEHLAYLSREIGSRGSCTPAEQQAANYVAGQLRTFGAREVRLEPFRGAASAYSRYALAFGVALLGLLVGLTWHERSAGVVAAALCGLGAWGMLAESDFAQNWTQWFIRGRPSQNVVGFLPAHSHDKSVVLTAHIDTHRTPVFNSTRAWQRTYNVAFKVLLGCQVAGSLFNLLSALPGVTWFGWLGVLPGFVLVIGLVLFIHADRTPFSPGAYDNASGVGSVLALAERLTEQPLNRTGVWVACTGCEETGASGMSDLLRVHRRDWQAAVIVNLDQMGLGRLYVRVREGLVIHRQPRSEVLALSRQVQRSLPHLGVFERPSQAFSDAAAAHKLGFSALSLGTMPAAASEAIHRHQMSDTVEHIRLEALRDTHFFVWELLRVIDLAAEVHPSSGEP